MRYLIQIILILCLSCCHNGGGISASDEKENELENLASESLIHENYEVHERKISLHPNGKSYLISVIPYKDSASNKYSTQLNMWHLVDSIFTKNINIDSLINTIVKHEIPSSDSIRIEELSNYNLVKIIPEGGWRAGYTYFTAKLESANKPKNIFIKFGIKYTVEIGKIWVGAFYYEGKDFKNKNNVPQQKI